MAVEDLITSSDIIEAYRNYSYALRAMETIISRQTNSELHLKRALTEGKKFDTINDILTPTWSDKKCDPEYREIFEDIGKTGKVDVKNSCCIFIDSTDPNTKNTFLLGTNPNTFAHEILFDYPTSVHSAVLIYDNDAKLKDMSFLVDGKYFLFYYGTQMEETLSEALFSSSLFYMQLETALCAIAQKISLDEQKIPYRNSDVWFESYASSYSKQLETTVLENQGKLLEYAQRTLQQRLKTNKNDTFEEAEKRGLISSARRFNEYADIRNLIYHHPDYYEQNDLAVKKGKNNEDILTRLKTTYAKYYLNPLRKRLSIELEILSDFQELIEQINPNFLIRKKTESSNKFIRRIKEKIKTSPTKNLCIDINCPLYDPTFKKIEKNIKKIFPDIKLASDCPEYYSDLDDMCTISFRKTMIANLWGNLSRTINHYLVSHGIKVEQKKSLKSLHEMHILTPQQMITLYEIKKLRNDISHNLSTKETINKLKTNFTDTITKLTEIETTIKENIPIGTIQDNIIEFKHENGKIVKIHAHTYKIISVSASQNNQLPPFPNMQKSRD